MTFHRLHHISRNGGFSLIEVLIAVLVLATGMLALAALQASLTRNSVDAKVRSQGLAVAVDTLDRVRAEASASRTDYQALPVADTGWTAWSAPSTFGALNVPTTFETRTAVARFIRDADPGDCGGAANTPCFRPAGASEGYQLSTTAEFKRVTVDVRWTDGDGTTRTATVNDVLTSVTRDKSSTLLTTPPTPPTGTGSPIARIPRPSEAGIIPIAVGNGRETAASNPKPVMGYERGRSDETQFQVYTYGTTEAGVAQLSRLIDTRIVGCRCELGNLPSSVPPNSDLEVLMNPFFRVAKQPTFWNGKEYTAPENGKPPSTPPLRGVPIDGANQNQELCATCCLDHHDAPLQLAKFDAVRSGGTNPSEPYHLHYGDDNNDGVLNTTAASAAGADYFEVCRFIRVDGIYRVATDAHLKYMNLLETDPTVTTESMPAAIPRTRYQALVKDLVGQFVLSSATTPNVSGYDDILVQPDVISLGRRLDKRFLHDRGLYIDALEPDAVQAISDAIDECPDASTEIDCVLPIIPFVSINTTGLAQWDSSNQAKVRVYNLARTVSPDPDDPPEPRGLTEALLIGSTEQARAVMQLSNSGLSDSYGIDLGDASQKAIDEQTVRVGAGGGSGSGGEILITAMSGASSISNMGIGTTDNADANSADCQATIDDENTGPREGPLPVRCQTAFNLPGVAKLRLKTYNPTSSPKRNVCGQNQTVDLCSNLDVTAVTVAGVAVDLTATGALVQTGSLLSEITTVNLGTVNAGNEVRLTFTSRGDTVAVHTCGGSTGKDYVPTYAPPCKQQP